MMKYCYIPYSFGIGIVIMW